LWLLEPERKLIGDNKSDIHKVLTIGPYPAGVELLFGINVVESGHWFKTGLGMRNPDGVPHAQVSFVEKNIAVVGFEDKINSRDRNYNNVRFIFRGVNPGPKQPLYTNSINASPSSDCNVSDMPDISDIANVSGIANTSTAADASCNQSCPIGYNNIQLKRYPLVRMKPTNATSIAMIQLIPVTMGCFTCFDKPHRRPVLGRDPANQGTSGGIFTPSAPPNIRVHFNNHMSQQVPISVSQSGHAPAQVPRMSCDILGGI